MFGRLFIVSAAAHLNHLLQGQILATTGNIGLFHHFHHGLRHGVHVRCLFAGVVVVLAVIVVVGCRHNEPFQTKLVLYGI